jgi:hypothetical protein
MGQKSVKRQRTFGEQPAGNIRAEEKIRIIVLDGLRDEHGIAELGRREALPRALHWSNRLPEAGKAEAGARSNIRSTSI